MHAVWRGDAQRRWTRVHRHAGVTAVEALLPLTLQPCLRRLNKHQEILHPVLLYGAYKVLAAAGIV